MPEPALFNIPNLLTLSRLLLAVVVCVCIALGWFAPALAVFTVAALTDAADGYVARALNQTSALGRQLDPLVDKVFVILVLVHLLPVFRAAYFPWVVSIIVAREFLVQALRSLVEGRGVAFGARWSGKLKTVVQCVAIALVLASLADWGGAVVAVARDIGLWTAAALTAQSGVEYLWTAWRLYHSGAIN